TLGLMLIGTFTKDKTLLQGQAISQPAQYQTMDLELHHLLLCPILVLDRPVLLSVRQDILVYMALIKVNIRPQILLLTEHILLYLPLCLQTFLTLYPSLSQPTTEFTR